MPKNAFITEDNQPLSSQINKLETIYGIKYSPESEIISKLESLYGVKYCADSDLTAQEQLDICEILAEGEKKEDKNNYKYNNVIVNGNVNDTQKLQENSKHTTQKVELINLLKLYNYRTPVYKIITVLEELFAECHSKEGHWSYIAHNYTLKSINSVIYNMTKSYGNWNYINNPASYFTSLIKYYKKKKRVRLSPSYLKIKIALSCKDGS